MNGNVEVIQEYVRTGIKGLDELLEGRGIPRGYIVFVLGSPGSGKTTLSLQFLYNGASIFNEPGVYVSLDEDVRWVRRNMLRFGWRLEELEREGKLELLDASPLRLVAGEVRLGEFSIGRHDFQLISLINAIKQSVVKVGAKRLVIDPISALILQYPTERERRIATMELMQAITNTGCTTLIISELHESSIDRAYQFEEYLAHGVIIIRKIVKPEGVVMSFQVEKMRGVDHDDQPKPYKITRHGIEVYI